VREWESEGVGEGGSTGNPGEKPVSINFLEPEWKIIITLLLTVKSFYQRKDFGGMIKKMIG